jgi:bla regulator protein blaR1
VAAQVSPPNAATPADGESKEVQLDPTLYDNYVGHYKFAETAVMAVSRDGKHLFTQLTGQGPVEIFPSSETEFFPKLVKAQLVFTTDAQGRATAVTLHQNGQAITAPRMDDQAAQQIEDRLAARVQGQAGTCMTCTMTKASPRGGSH